MKTTKQRLLAIVSVIILSISILTPTATQASAASIKLNKKKVSITMGKSYTLKLTGTKKKPTWTSSNKKIAKVSKKGKVTGVNDGKATITAKLSGKKYKCTVTVKPDAATKKLYTKFDYLKNYIKSHGDYIDDPSGGWYDTNYVIDSGTLVSTYIEDGLEYEKYWLYEMAYDPRYDCIQINHTEDYTSDEFDFDNDEAYFTRVMMYRKDIKNCNILVVDYAPSETGHGYSSALNNVPKKNITANPLFRNWDVTYNDTEQPVYITSIIESAMNDANLCLSDWYDDISSWMYSLTDYHLTDLGFGM